MKGISRWPPSPAMVVACLALFVALGTGTYAAVKIKLKPNQVKAKNLRAGAVTESKIANNAVTEAKIATNAVTAGKIAANAVGTEKIADSAVIAAKLAPASVTKGKFAVTGVASNTGNFTLNNSCTVATFTATGVQPGDVVAFSMRDAPGVGGLLVAQPAEDEVTANTLKIQLCEVNAAAANITTGSILLDFVAIR
jgi:trimeric autotransporter adhesin